MPASLLCFDVGGTRLRGALLHADGVREDDQPPRVHCAAATYRERPTPQTWEDLDACLQSLLKEWPTPYDGVAFAVAGSIRDRRVVRETPNVPFLRSEKDTDLAAWLERVFGAPTVVVNDMEAALAGEVAQGSLRGCQWAFMDTISTGWGGAMLYRGEPVAAEPGHIVVSSSTQRCLCGRTDCAEVKYSGGAVRQRVRERTEREGIALPRDTDPCAFATTEAEKEAPWARELYTEVARGIGDIWGSRLNLCPPVRQIVYTGAFVSHTMQLPFFRETVLRALRARSLFRDDHARVTVTAARVSHGALVGAAHLFFRSPPQKNAQ